jgi:hypothetical protein
MASSTISDVMQYVVNGAFILAYLTLIPFILIVAFRKHNILFNRRILFMLLIPMAVISCGPPMLRIVYVPLAWKGVVFEGVIRRLVKLVAQWNDYLIFLAFFWITHLFATACNGLQGIYIF